MENYSDSITPHNAWSNAEVVPVALAGTCALVFKYSSACLSELWIFFSAFS